MKNKLSLLPLLLPLSASLIPAQAHAFKLSVAGEYVVPIETGAAGSWGGGALLETSLAPAMGIELGGILGSVKTADQLTGIGTSATSLLIPVLLRFNLIPTLSLGAGGFYQASLESGGTSNAGLEGSLRLVFPVIPTFSLFVDGRYNLGLKDIGGSKYSDLPILAGGTFSL